MMTRYAKALRLAVRLTALAALLPGFAMAAEYSADTLRTAPGMPPQAGKIFVGKQSIRRETARHGRTIVEIASRDDGVVRVIMPDEGVYLERRLDPAQTPAMEPKQAPCEPAPHLACAKTGDVEINGMKAERWDVGPAGAPFADRIWWDPERKIALREELADGRVMQATLRGEEEYEGEPVESWELLHLAPDGSYTRTVTLYSAKLGVPVRTQWPNGAAIQLSNIKAGAPDAALFEVPEGVRKLEPNFGPPRHPPHGFPPPWARPPHAAMANQAPAGAGGAPDASTGKGPAKRKLEPKKP